MDALLTQAHAVCPVNVQRLKEEAASIGLLAVERAASDLEAKMRNDPALDITGMLLASDTHFFQLLEGPADAV